MLLSCFFNTCTLTLHHLVLSDISFWHPESEVLVYKGTVSIQEIFTFFYRVTLSPSVICFFFITIECMTLSSPMSARKVLIGKMLDNSTTSVTFFSEFSFNCTDGLNNGLWRYGDQRSGTWKQIFPCRVSGKRFHYFRSPRWNKLVVGFIV